MSKTITSSLTRFRNQPDPTEEAWELVWRLRAAQNYLSGAARVAERNAERWPVMHHELTEAQRHILANLGTALDAYRTGRA